MVSLSKDSRLSPQDPDGCLFLVPLPPEISANCPPCEVKIRLTFVPVFVTMNRETGKQVACHSESEDGSQNMEARIENGKLHVIIDLYPQPQSSTSGKTLVVASMNAYIQR